MSSVGHVIWPRPSGRTITECLCVLAAGSVATRLQGEGMIGNRGYKSTTLATASHMFDKMSWSPFPSKENNKLDLKWKRSCGWVTNLWPCLDTVCLIQKHPDCVYPAEMEYSLCLAIDFVSIDCLSSDFASLLRFGICQSGPMDKIKQRKIHIHAHLTQLAKTTMYLVARLGSNF